jgi:hypothetical protein
MIQALDVDASAAGPDGRDRPAFLSRKKIHHVRSILAIIPCNSQNRTRIAGMRSFFGVAMTDNLEAPPTGAELTAYDRENTRLYLRLLDAEADGADWREVASTLFGVDPNRQPDRARQVYESHLARAHWMASDGYKLLIKEGYPSARNS